MSTTRLPPAPVNSNPVIDSTQTLTFSFDNKTITAHPGDSIAAALYAAGVRIFSRSFKYHRPRGLLCVAGNCPNCLMNVDGTPSVRTCREPVRQDMRVRSQNAWPSLESDALAINDKLDRLLPIGFYYKTFIHPKAAWPIAEKVLRRVAGLGKIDHQAKPHGGYDHQYRHTDIAVVGGGPAGLIAAREAARLGAQVTLIDDEPILGGHLRTQTQTYSDVDPYSGMSGTDLARQLRQEVEALPGLDIIQSATVFGQYEGGLLGVMHAKRLIHLRTKRLVVATGAYEYPPVFHNNDLPGVMLGSGVQRLMHLYRVKPGARAVVVTNSETGLSVACDLLAAGVEVAALVAAHSDLADLWETDERVQHLQANNVEILAPHIIQAAQGKKRVEAALVTPLDAQRQPLSDSGRIIPCDLICLSTNRATAGALLTQSGCRLAYDATLGEIIPQKLAPHVFAAGDVTGLHQLSAILRQGQVAGIQAALSLELHLDLLDATTAQNQLDRYQQDLTEIEQQYRKQVQPYPQLNAASKDKKKFVCLCEDVTAKDLADGIAEGFDEIETLKRYSTISMGPCQGRMCAMSSIGICAHETGRSLEETGSTTPRPPIQPVPLGVLAGRHYHPVKRTPLHHTHVALKAEMMNLGDWKRPYSYTTPAAECQAVRERVGLIDVSTLGKLDVKGKDAGILLDKVYTHVFSSLRVGRVRYGVMCDDSGIIIDDGTVSRLAEDHFFITTTTGNIEFVEQWLKWWSVGTGLCVHVTNVTGGFAAMNLAGPRARDVLRQLTDYDLSSSSFPYMACVQAEVTGVPALLLRIGFVGETGWEMHVPAEYGEQVWEALMAAGKAFEIAPFGVEAQRILRLEKKHLIVGQDTDALSNPLEADLAWAVKFNKKDFIGKNALLSVQERGLRQKLVGFTVRDSVVVEGGSAVALNGKPVGRVASARFSPAAGKCVGLAWVPIALATKGDPFHIRINGGLVEADIAEAAFYDPEGKRVRA